jgi:dTDP-4-dehydrorhamnose reductase
MTTVVTGANGLVGSRIVARLLKDNERVVGVGRGPVRDAALGEYVEIDLLSHPRKLGQLIESLQPQGVIHAAAMTDVDGCESAPVEAWALNVRSVEEAALACAGISARFTAVSTDYVFDGAKGAYAEDAVPNPRGVYARSKRAGEYAALLLAPDCAVARVAVVYSGRRGAKRTFATSAAEQLLAGKEVRAFHDQVVSPTLADNAAEMVIGVHRSGAPGMFHCAGATQSTRVEFCRALARKLRADEALIVPVLLSDLKLPAPRPLRCGLRVEKVQRLLGHSVPLPLDAALDRFLEERAGG